MTANNPDGVASIDGMMEPDVVADSVVRAIEAEQSMTSQTLKGLSRVASRT